MCIFLPDNNDVKIGESEKINHKKCAEVFQPLHIY